MKAWIWANRWHAGLFFVALLVIGALGHQFAETKDLPAWIQAGGAVLAIIASFWVSDLGRQADQRRKMQAIAAVIQAAQKFAAEVEKLVNTPDRDLGMANPAIYNLYHREVTNGLAKALSDIPLLELGMHGAVRAVLSLHGQFLHFLPPTIEAYIDGPQNHLDMKDKVRDYDDLPLPERTVKQRQLRETQFAVLANNLKTRLGRIDHDCAVVLQAVRRV